VPFLMAGADIEPAGQATYDEATAAAGPLVEPGWQLMGRFINGTH
jgi:hypothetical protein